MMVIETERLYLREYTNTASCATAMSAGMKKVKEYPDEQDGITYVCQLTREEWQRSEG